MPLLEIQEWHNFSYWLPDEQLRQRIFEEVSPIAQRLHIRPARRVVEEREARERTPGKRDPERGRGRVGMGAGQLPLSATFDIR